MPRSFVLKGDATFVETYYNGRVRFGCYPTERDHYVNKQDYGPPTKRTPPSRIERRMNLILFDEEEQQSDHTMQKLDALRRVLNETEFNPKRHDPIEWYRAAAAIRHVLGNFDNDVSFVACLLAKQFLYQRHTIAPFNVAEKPQGAPGLDFDVESVDGERIIAELKTTVPYRENDLGSNQRDSFLRDFDKLARTPADFKYFFVTDAQTYHVVNDRYRQFLPGVELVLLADGPASMAHFAATGPIKAQPVPGGRSPTHADSIRAFLRDRYFEPARRNGTRYLQLRSGDVHQAMGLHNRYPAVCNAMSNQKVEKSGQVRIVKTEGATGANFYVTYSLVAN